MPERRVLTVTLEDQGIARPPQDDLGQCAKRLRSAPSSGRRAAGGGAGAAGAWRCPNPAVGVHRGRAYCAAHLRAFGKEGKEGPEP